MCAVGILTSCFSQSVGVIKSRADTLVWRRLVANQTAECRNYGFYGTGEEKEPFYRHHCCGFVVVSTLNNLKRKWWYWNFKIRELNLQFTFSSILSFFLSFFTLSSPGLDLDFLVPVFFFECLVFTFDAAHHERAPDQNVQYCYHFIFFFLDGAFVWNVLAFSMPSFG